MIELSAKQLTWIVVGACSLGGTGYLDIVGSIGELNKTTAVSVVKSEAIDEKLAVISDQLTKLSDKLDSKGKK